MTTQPPASGTPLGPPSFDAMGASERWDNLSSLRVPGVFRTPPPPIDSSDPKPVVRYRMAQIGEFFTRLRANRMYPELNDERDPDQAVRLAIHEAGEAFDAFYRLTVVDDNFQHFPPHVAQYCENVRSLLQRLWSILTFLPQFPQSAQRGFLLVRDLFRALTLYVQQTSQGEDASSTVSALTDLHHAMLSFRIQRNSR